MKSIIKGIFLVSLLSFVATVSYANPGDVLWENYFDREDKNGDDIADKVVACGNKVFVVGLTITDANAGAFSVRAYNAMNGSLLWENYLDRGTGWERAVDVAVNGNKVFVVGNTITDEGDLAFSIRAYKAKNGKILWEDHFDREGKGRDWANAVAVEDNRVFAVGYTESASGISAFSVRAYDTNTGTLLWEDYFNREETKFFNNAYDVGAKDNKVFVVGETYTSKGDAAFSIRTYDAVSGKLLWEDYFDREGKGGDVASAVAVRDNRVCVVGSTHTAVGGYAFSVRTYDATTGTLLWENYFDKEGNGADGAYAVAVKGNKVFVVGTIYTTTGGNAFSIRTYNVTTGKLLWENYFNRQGNGWDGAFDLAVSGKNVFAVGTTRTEIGGFAFSVRAHDIVTGALNWEDYFDREDNGGDGASAVAVKNKRVFVTGYTHTKTGGRAFSIRAYSK